MAKRQVKAEKAALTNPKLHDKFHLIKMLDSGFSDDVASSSKSEVHGVFNDKESRINNGPRSGIALEMFPVISC